MLLKSGSTSYTRGFGGISCHSLCFHGITIRATIIDSFRVWTPCHPQEAYFLFCLEMFRYCKSVSIIPISTSCHLFPGLSGNDLDRNHTVRAAVWLGHCGCHYLYLWPHKRKSAGWLPLPRTGMAWLCYDSEAIWISHKVVRAGILYWQVIIHSALHSPHRQFTRQSLPSGRIYQTLRRAKSKSTTERKSERGFSVNSCEFF